MKQGWEYKKLGEVCSLISDGSHNPPKGVNHSTYRMISSQNVFDDNLLITNSNVRYITESDHLIEDKRTRLKNGVVLLTIVGTIGRSCVLKGNEGFLTLQRSVAALHPTDKIKSRFLMYSLIGNRDNLNKEAHGIAQKGIYLKQLSSLEIPLPPKSTQLSIVSELDQINELIRLKKEQLKDYDNLAQSIFYEMFGDPVENEKGWKVKTIKDTCTLKSGDSKANNSHKGDLPYVKVGDMNLPGNENYINISTTYVDRESNINRIFPVGTIIFPKRGGAILTNKKRLTNVEICCDLNTMGVIPGDMLNKYYLFQYFKILDLSTICSGSTVLQLNNCDINPLKIPLPPLPLQHLFAQRIEQIERQKSAVQKSITDLETLLASRMQYWFE